MRLKSSLENLYKLKHRKEKKKKRLKKNKINRAELTSGKI